MGVIIAVSIRPKGAVAGAAGASGGVELVMVRPYPPTPGLRSQPCRQMPPRSCQSRPGSEAGQSLGQGAEIVERELPVRAQRLQQDVDRTRGQMLADAFGDDGGTVRDDRIDQAVATGAAGVAVAEAEPAQVGDVV